MPGAASARATAGIRRSASSRTRKPTTATGIHGTPCPRRVWYQPWSAITALAAVQPPSTAAATPASSAAVRRAKAGPQRPPVQQDAGRGRDRDDADESDRPHIARRVVHDSLHG